MSQRLLIVDDSKAQHELIKFHLGTEDFAFVSAYGGASGLDIASSVLPDLILLDVQMPDMNGFDVCRFLKASPITARIPVIFLTACTSADEKVCGLDLEAVDYIAKPFHPDELASRVRAALRTKRLLDLLPAERMNQARSDSQSQANPNARLPMSQLQSVRSANPWNRKPPARAAFDGEEADNA